MFGEKGRRDVLTSSQTNNSREKDGGDVKSYVQYRPEREMRIISSILSAREKKGVVRLRIQGQQKKWPTPIKVTTKQFKLLQAYDLRTSPLSMMEFVALGYSMLHATVCLTNRRSPQSAGRKEFLTFSFFQTDERLIRCSMPRSVMQH